MSGQGDRRAVTYFGEQGAAVVFSYRRGNLVALKPGDALTAAERDALVDAIAAAAGEAAEVVSRSVMFAPVPTRGGWRHRNFVQLGEPPPEAPKPGALLGDHPVILEVRHRRSDDFLLQATRSEHAVQAARLVLNVVMGWQLQWLTHFTTFAWVFPQELTSELVPTYQKRGYHIPGFERYADDFRDIDEVMPTAPVLDVYGRLGIQFDDVFTVPDAAGGMLDAFELLQGDQQARFLRGAYWFAHSHRVRHESRSAAFLALVQALEALLDPPTGEAKGEGPSARFRRLVDRYAPGTAASERRDFYRTRSKVAHGGVLFDDLDTAVMGGLHGGVIEDSVRYETLNRIARVVLVNWLVDSVLRPFSQPGSRPDDRSDSDAR